MKIGIITDVHWSTTTSVVRARGEKYSQRLELLIKGLTWANNLFAEKKCDRVVCAGDFFDKSTCTDEELSALKEVKWLNVPNDFIVGNHESSRADLEFTSVDALDNDNFNIIKRPISLTIGNTQIFYVPYVVESDRKPLMEYLKDYDNNKKHVVFSHNDISGIQYGGFLSKTGFSVEEIEQSCDLYLNGHIHNGQWVTNKVLNLGSLTAQNFTNDSFAYKYGAWILDTDTLEMTFYENPYSLNFYKIDIDKDSDLNKLDGLKPNSVLSLKCSLALKDKLQEKLTNNKNILLNKTIYERTELLSEDSVEDISIPKSDYLAKFSEVVIEELGSTEVVLAELREICK